MSLIVLNAPMLIARPSVVASKAHETRIVYNNKGLPLTVTETGFSPIDATAALADARGFDPGKTAQSLSRSAARSVIRTSPSTAAAC